MRNHLTRLTTGRTTSAGCGAVTGGAGTIGITAGAGSITTTITTAIGMSTTTTTGMAIGIGAAGLRGTTIHSIAEARLTIERRRATSKNNWPPGKRVAEARVAALELTNPDAQPESDTTPAELA